MLYLYKKKGQNLNKKVIFKYEHNFAFTLAEVLITLGIIGVVAALTIPTLISNYQKQEYVAKLKKTYSILTQAFLELTNEYGCNGNLVCTGLLEEDEGISKYTYYYYSKKLSEKLIKYIKTAEICGIEPNKGCFPSATASNFDGTGNKSNMDADSYYKFVTVDGVAIYIANGADNCTTITDAIPACGWVTLDINGPKKPNAIGRDTFYFDIINTDGVALLPSGSPKMTGVEIDDSPYPCTKENPIGYYCTAKIVQNGWQMDY